MEYCFHNNMDPWRDVLFQGRSRFFSVRFAHTLTPDDAELHEFALVIGPRAGPGANLTAAARDACGQAARQDVPAEETMVGGGARQRLRIAGQDFVAESAKPVAENFAH